MIRFLFRFTGLWLLAGAFVTLVIDGTRSVSASRLIMVPVRDAWALVDPSGLDAIQKKAAGSLYEAALGLLLASPFFALLVVAGLLFLLIGRKKQDSRIGYSARD